MGAEIIQGDCLDVMQFFPSNSFDSCVTDPPYNLESIKRRFGAANAAPAHAGKTGAYVRASRGFMGKTWDSDVAFQPETWAEVLRVLKPGAHLAAFGGSRTYHRLACAIEDAGFEIRDQIMWVYGSGFPKSHNLDGEWAGWGTALKPAHEPICVARKPLAGTVAANVMVYGTGAINIDGCRVEAGADHAANCNRNNVKSHWGHSAGGKAVEASALGRWPANIVHDGSDEVVDCFPAHAGAAAPASGPSLRGKNTSVARGQFNGLAADDEPAFHADKGSAARFFYCAKASRADRNDGLAAFDEKPLLWSSGTQNPGSFQSDGTHKAARNPHPTVKPTELMRWLCRLITPPGGSILDPFAGSGSTGRGAVLEGFDFTGVELTAEYVPIARARIAAVQSASGVFA